MSKTQPKTRSEAHADSSVQQVRESRRIVRQALEDYCIGRDNARSGREISEKVPVKYTTTRDIIAELRDDPDGPPIGNCGDGYFIIETRTELDEWTEQKKDEIQTIKERMQSNIRSYNQRRYQ